MRLVRSPYSTPETPRTSPHISRRSGQGPGSQAESAPGLMNQVAPRPLATSRLSSPLLCCPPPPAAHRPLLPTTPAAALPTGPQACWASDRPQLRAGSDWPPLRCARPAGALPGSAPRHPPPPAGPQRPRPGNGVAPRASRAGSARRRPGAALAAPEAERGDRPGFASFRHPCAPSCPVNTFLRRVIHRPA